MTQPLTAAELAEALHVSPATVNAWASARLIPFSQIGRVRRFDLAEVLEATKQPVRMARELRPVLQHNDDFSELRQLIARHPGRSGAGTKKAARRANA